jgi:hypothetical protein
MSDTKGKQTIIAIIQKCFHARFPNNVYTKQSKGEKCLWVSFSPAVVTAHPPDPDGVDGLRVEQGLVTGVHQA